jgi:hypothetical protein
MTDFFIFPKSDYETLAEFRYALRCFLHISESASGMAGFTYQQHQALLFTSATQAKDKLRSEN